MKTLGREFGEVPDFRLTVSSAAANSHSLVQLKRRPLGVDGDAQPSLRLVDKLAVKGLARLGFD